MQMVISLEATVVASKNQVTADLADEVVILSLKDGEYYGLNAVGAKIWSLIQQPCTPAAIRDHLLAEYPEVDPERCTRDTLAILEQLAKAALIEVTQEGELSQQA